MSSGTKTGSSTEQSTEGKQNVAEEKKPNNGLFNRQKSKGRLFKSTKPGPVGKWNPDKLLGLKKKEKSSPAVQKDKDQKTEPESIVDIEVEDVTFSESVDQVGNTDKNTAEINTEADNIKNDNLEKGKGTPNVVVEINNETSEAKKSSETAIPNGDASKQNGHVAGKPVVPNGVSTVSNGLPPKKENSFFREKSTLAPPKTPISKKERTESPESKKSLTRRDSSKLSLDGSSRVSVDAALQTAGVVYPTEDKPPQKSVISNNDSWIRSAIPTLPLWFAITCLVLNILIPGSGTILSGCSILCCGKARVQAKDDQLTVTLCVNIMVGIAQLFTVTFLFVGWFWSLAWGLKMVSIAVEYRHQKKQQRERELQALALSAFGSPSRVRSLFSAV